MRRCIARDDSSACRKLRPLPAQTPPCVPSAAATYQMKNRCIFELMRSDRCPHCCMLPTRPRRTCTLHGARRRLNATHSTLDPLRLSRATAFFLCSLPWLVVLFSSRRESGRGRIDVNTHLKAEQRDQARCSRSLRHAWAKLLAPLPQRLHFPARTLRAHAAFAICNVGVKCRPGVGVPAFWG